MCTADCQKSEGENVVDICANPSAHHMYLTLNALSVSTARNQAQLAAWSDGGVKPRRFRTAWPQPTRDATNLSMQPHSYLEIQTEDSIC